MFPKMPVLKLGSPRVVLLEIDGAFMRLDLGKGL
jgi:hypothetical protein